MGEKQPFEDGHEGDPFEEFEGAEEAEPFDIVLSPLVFERLERVTARAQGAVADMVATALRARALLLDPSRVSTGILCRMALYDGPVAKPAHRTPIEERWVAAAMQEELERDLEDERNKVPIQAPVDSRFAFLSGTLGVPMELARMACVTINQLEDRPRRAFFDLAVLLEPIEVAVAHEWQDRRSLLEALDEALQQLAQYAWAIDPEILRKARSATPFDLQGGIHG